MKAVIFDMDGVLIDSEPIHMAIENEMLHSMGINMTKDEMSQFIGTSSHEMWTELIARYKLEKTASELHRLSKELKSNYFRNEFLEPVVGVVSLLEELKEKNFKLAVASSSPLEHIHIIIKKLGIDHFFHDVISGEQVAFSKPDPDIFLLTAKGLGVEPSQCVVIEDSTHGVAAAKSAGMTCIAYANPNSLNQSYDKADVVVYHMEDVSIG